MPDTSESQSTVSPGRNRLALAFLGSGLLVAVIDAASKMAAWAWPPGQAQGDFGGLLQLHLHQNPGFMLGIGSSLDADYRSLVLSAITATALLGLLVVLLYRGFTRLDLAIAWGAVVGSAAANLAERLINGAVTDILQLDLMVVKTGIFNLADLFNLAGLCFIAANILFRNRAL